MDTNDRPAAAMGPTPSDGDRLPTVPVVHLVSLILPAGTVPTGVHVAVSSALAGSAASGGWPDSPPGDEVAAGDDEAGYGHGV